MTPLTSVRSVSQTTETNPEQIQLTRAARELEGMFLTQMLKNLEKTTRLEGSQSTSRSPYGSMVVEAMANAISAGGGIGLADVILENISREP